MISTAFVWMKRHFSAYHRNSPLIEMTAEITKDWGENEFALMPGRNKSMLWMSDFDEEYACKSAKITHQQRSLSAHWVRGKIGKGANEWMNKQTNQWIEPTPHTGSVRAIQLYYRAECRTKADTNWIRRLSQCSKLYTSKRFLPPIASSLSFWRLCRRRGKTREKKPFNPRQESETLLFKFEAKNNKKKTVEHLLLLL